MKKETTILFVALLCLWVTSAAAQGTSRPERKLFKEYTSPEELVSIAPTTPMDKAFAAISDVSRKFVGKIIIDTDRRTAPVAVDIQAMQWRDALEVICRKHNLWYTEFENYIQIAAMGATVETAAGPVGSADIQREIASIRSREVKITAYFFEVNLNRIEEVGINWNFVKSTSDYTIDGSFVGADRVSAPMLNATIIPKISFANIDLLASLFSNFDLGEVLSGPQVVVRSGEEGRIQVGQDFSIKERDFAGNIIDKFYSAGTIIKVRPQVITQEGVTFIHLLVDAERSSVTPGALTTIINKTKANTNLLLLDGEETVIGGLYNTELSTIRTGVPFLKDLPWYVLGLRYLFGYDKDEVKKKELIILLRAQLVPTLQERITERVKEGPLYDRWREEQMRDAERVRGSGGE